MSLTFHSVLRKLYTEPSIGASYQISVHLVTRFQRRRFFRNQSIRNKNGLWWPCLWMDWDKMSNLYRGPSIDATYQVWVLPSVSSFGKAISEKNFFLEIDQSETRISCGRHVCWRIRMKLAFFIEDLPQMLPTKFRFIWPSGFREDFFYRNQPIRNKNCLWQPWLLTDRDEMSNLYRGPSIDASYQGSVHLVKRSQGRRFF